MKDIQSAFNLEMTHLTEDRLTLVSLSYLYPEKKKIETTKNRISLFRNALGVV